MCCKCCQMLPLLWLTNTPFKNSNSASAPLVPMVSRPRFFFSKLPGYQSLHHFIISYFIKQESRFKTIGVYWLPAVAKTPSQGCRIMVCLLTINRDIHMLAPDAQCLYFSLIIWSPFTSWQSGNHISFLSAAGNIWIFSCPFILSVCFAHYKTPLIVSL